MSQIYLTHPLHKLTSGYQTDVLFDEGLMKKEYGLYKFRTAGNVCGILMYLIAAAMLVFSGYLCFSPDIWYDELFSVQFAIRPISEMIRLTAADVHPPLYYIIVHFLIVAFDHLGNILGISNTLSSMAGLNGSAEGVIGAAGVYSSADSMIGAASGTLSGPLSVIYAKLASLIPFIILFIYAITIIRKRYSAFIGGLFSCVVIAMPQITDFTVEIRMYSWVMLFVTALCIHSAPFLETDKNRQIKGLRWGKAFPVFIYGLMACYTQYYAAVAVAFIYLFLVIWSVRKNIYQLGIILISGNLTVVCYIPWVGVVLSQARTVSTNYWIQPLSIRSFGGIIKFLMKPGFFNEKLSATLAVLMFALVAFVVITNIRDAYMWLCFMPVIAIIAFGFAASFLLRPVFIYRYMIPGMGALWLGVLIGVKRGFDKINIKTKENGDCNEIAKEAANETAKEKTNEKPGEKASLSLVNYAKTGLCFLLAGLMIVFCIRDFWAFRGNELYKRVNMENVDRLLADDYEDTTIICNFDQVSALSLYYFNKMGDIALENGKNLKVPVYLYGAMTDVYLETIIPGIQVIETPQDVRKLIDSKRKVLFLGSFNSREDIIRDWKETEGINNKNTGSYLLERYWVDVFELS